MADDDAGERKGFWRRMKDKLAGGSKPKPAEEKDEASARRAGDGQEERSPRVTTGAGEPSVLSISELKTDTVGRVYAQALIELAQEQGQVDAVAQEVQDLMPLVSEGGELHRLLTNPAIGDTERGEIVKRVFAGKISPLLYKLLRVMGDKGRLGSLPQVAAGYLLAVAKERGQVEVQAFVATELDAAAAKQVADQIGQALGKTVSLTQKVDPSLIGGLKIKVGDRLIDASVASQLRNMKNKMIAAGRG